MSGPEARRAARIFARSAIELLAFPFHVGGQTIFVGTSIGIAVADVSDLSAEELLRRADVAMYHAKQQGKNRIFMYDAEIDALRSERIGIASDLRRAIAGDQLTVAYQPVYDAGSRQIVAAEALLRWTRPGAGPMPPSAFIPIAEETGLIDALGAWTLRRACRDALAWPDTRLAVNISPAQFRNQNFITMVSETLAETGFPASRLELEVTETYFISQPDQARIAIEALHKIGVSLALDDFGTGYSSIGYLRRFRFDVLKLDRSMILNIANDRARAEPGAGDDCARRRARPEGHRRRRRDGGGGNAAAGRRLPRIPGVPVRQALHAGPVRRPPETPHPSRSDPGPVRLNLSRPRCRSPTFRLGPGSRRVQRRKSAACRVAPGVRIVMSTVLFPSMSTWTTPATARTAPPL